MRMCRVCANPFRRLASGYLGRSRGRELHDRRRLLGRRSPAFRVSCLVLREPLGVVDQTGHLEGRRSGRVRVLRREPHRQHHAADNLCRRKAEASEL